MSDATQVASRPREGTIPPALLYRSERRPLFCPTADTGREGGLMSRELPTHPNLDHLRKQARRRLRELRRNDPNTRLADAQHSIAREYGFASWPLLKTHVESAPEHPSPAAPNTPSSTGGTGGRRGAAIRADSPPP